MKLAMWNSKSSIFTEFHRENRCTPLAGNPRAERGLRNGPARVLKESRAAQRGYPPGMWCADLAHPNLCSHKDGQFMVSNLWLISCEVCCSLGTGYVHIFLFISNLLYNIHIYIMLNHMLGTSACFTDRGPHFQGRLWPRRSSATVRTAVDSWPTWVSKSQWLS